METPKPKILIVDDLPVVRMNVSLLLRLEGYEVIEAQDGEEGLQKALSERPDLIIADVAMPKRSGLELLKAIRQTQTLSTVPVILLSAHSEREDIRRGMEMGADDYITKPFKNYELVRAVNRLLERHRQFQRQVEEKLEYIRDVVFYALPHEFRTAINGIKGYAKMITQVSGQEVVFKCDEIQEIGTEILHASQRLERLMENLLTYAQLRAVEQDEALQQQMRQEVTSCAQEVVVNAAVMVARRYERESDLQLSLSHTVPIAIGYQHWQKILVEILDNAFKFSSPGSIVEVTDVVDREYYGVVIRDHGEGMTVEQWEQIGAFVQFGRKEREQQGLGLGLAIALLLLDFHRGRLEVGDTPNGGTTVRVWIPIVEEKERGGGTTSRRWRSTVYRSASGA